MRSSLSITNDDLLSGWKAIANYLDCRSRTAQRWEKKDGLPIIRPDGSTKGPVFASKRALDVWLKGDIENVVLTTDQVIAFGRGSRALWIYEFAASIRNPAPEELEWRLRILDVDGTGEKGVLVAVQLQSGIEANRLLYLSSGGKLVWTVQTVPELWKADGVPFEGAWTIKHVIVVRESKGWTIWIALANHAGWGGAILRVDAKGLPSLQFANAGHIERLCFVPSPGGNVVVACGENNDFDSAFVALLGINDPPASSIHGKRTVYRFANAPSALPRTYILFPRSELIMARKKPYGHATAIEDYQDRIIVHVETGGEGAYFLYHFRRDLEPMYVFPSGSHEYVHAALERSRLIAHPWARCPERKKPLTLRVWTATSGWRFKKIPWRDDPWKDD